MESNYFIFANLFNPVILFFILGIIAGLLKSDLELPSGVSKFLHVYLLIAIGFKGGVSINEISIKLIIGNIFSQVLRILIFNQ